MNVRGLINNSIRDNLNCGETEVASADTAKCSKDKRVPILFNTHIHKHDDKRFMYIFFTKANIKKYESDGNRHI